MTDKPVIKRVRSVDELLATPGSALFIKGDPGPWTIVVDGMTDKPEAVAWMYRHTLTPSLCHIVQARWSPDMAAGWTETALYPEPPSQPDACALVEAARNLETAIDALAATRSHSTYLSMIDNDNAAQALLRLDGARQAARAALTAWEQANG